MRLIDAFTFYNAIDVLKMRLKLHSPYVDQFYICESSHTYSGKPKPYNLEKRLDEFAPWADKITYIKFEPDLTGLDFSKHDTTVNYNFDSPAWNLEFQQRNILQKYLMEIDDDDVVIITDMDEFISPHVLSGIKQNSKSQSWQEARLHLQYFHYYMNCIKPGTIWSHPFVCKGRKFKIISDISLHRHLAGIDMHYPDAGWHFSYLGGLDVVMDKFLATSHTEQLAAGLNDEKYVRKCMDLGMDFLLHKPEPKLANCVSAYLPLSVFPPEIKALMAEFPHFVRTDLKDGNNS